MAVFRNKSMKIDALRRVPVFASLPKKDLDTLAKHTTEVTRPAGTVLVKQDRRGHQMFYLEEGSVVVKRNGRKVAELGPGEVVGELSLIDGQPASAEVVATEDVVLLVMSPAEFNAVLNEVPNFPRKLMTSLATRLREADARLVS